MSANLHACLLAVDRKSFGLQIRQPHTFGVALREAYVIAVLLAFAGNLTSLH